MKLTIADPTSWLVAPYSWRTAETLAQELDVPLVAAMVLAGRGFSDPGEARAFLDCSAFIPDPFLLTHMEGAVSAVSNALDDGKRIVVHGDYDADGITATALMVLALSRLGAKAEWYLPSRFNEGFGLSRTAVGSIAAGGPALLVTVDCGINYPDEVALAKEFGLEVIVVDHHRPGSRLPDCHLIHPAVGRYPHSDLSAVGLALKLMHGVHCRRDEAPANAVPQSLREFLDLVAVGTIADLAELRGENRYYVKEGLKLIAIGARPGLRALADISGCKGRVDSGAVAYRLAPRLNAAGRLSDASPPLRLLLTESESEAGEIAARLHELNGARQDVERKIFDEAISLVEALPDLPPVIVLAAEGWHEGVVGIVATRLVERYYRPAIILGVRDRVAKGSGRSLPAYDLMAGLNACAQHLTVYGGHHQAVGLTLESDRTDDFRRAIEEHAGVVLDRSDLTPSYHADAVLRGEDVNADTAVALASLGPFGSGNPRPRLLLVGAEIHQPETTRTGGHLRCAVDLDGVRTRAIGFGLGGAAASLRDEGRDRLLGVQFRVDEWQGSLRPEFVVEQIGSGAGEPATLFECGECRSGGGNLRAGQAPNDSGDPGTETGHPSRVRRRTGTKASSTRTKASFSASRDLRDRPGASGALVQVLATGEPAIILVCSVPHALPRARDHLMSGTLRVGSIRCIGRGCCHSHVDHQHSDGVLVAEWDVVAGSLVLTRGRVHVIASDPPYREEHVDLLREAVNGGALLHLYYGEEERRATGGLLRYMVHPRFAMVCVYRAMEDGLSRNLLFARAAALAWEEMRVALTWEDLSRAHTILAELGIERAGPREARIEARRIPAYAEAEAEYEECSRLCQTL